MTFNTGEEVIVTGPGMPDKRKFTFGRYIDASEIGEFVRVPLLNADDTPREDESGPLFEDKWKPGPFAWLLTVGLKVVNKDGEIQNHDPYLNWAIVDPFPVGPFPSMKIVPVEFIQDVEADRLEAENKTAEMISQIGEGRRSKKKAE